jgi:phosphate transport system substrate-binding protein
LKTCGGLLLAALLVTGARAEPLRIYGSTTAAQAVRPAAGEIIQETGADLAFETSAGSGAAIIAVANGHVDLAMATRSVTPQDRSTNPAYRLFDLEIGLQVLVPIVSKQTWQGGLHSVRKQDLIALYEGDLTSWKSLGGPDVKPVFLNPVEGGGVWEPFVTWLYGNLNRAGPGRRWKLVQTGEQARDLVATTPGALSVISPKWLDERVVALSIADDAGAAIQPREENFRSRKWPLVRPIVLVAGNKPSGPLRKVLQFMVSPKGLSYVEAAGFLSRPEVAEEMAAKMR